MKQWQGQYKVSGRSILSQMLPSLTRLDCYLYSELLIRMTQCCMGQDGPSVLLYMMHSNNKNNIISYANGTDVDELHTRQVVVEVENVV